MVVAGDGRRIGECLAPPLDRRGIEDGSRSSERLSTGGFMRRRRGLVACWLLILSIGAAAQSNKPKEERRTPTMVLDHTVMNLEEEFVPAAEAMPEDKFDFAPSNGEFKGVRT